MKEKNHTWGLRYICVSSPVVVVVMVGVADLVRLKLQW